MVAIRVSLPVPLRRGFDYEYERPLAPGVRVRVPWGRRVLTGFVIEVPADPVPGVARRAILEVIDDEPLLSAAQLQLLYFAADYYHHPLGEVLFAALPAGLKRGRGVAAPQVYVLTPEGQAAADTRFARAKRQAALWQAIKAAGVMTEAALKALGPGFGPAMRALLAQGLVERRDPERESPRALSPSAVTLRPDQQAACKAVAEAYGRFAAFLVFGVTGSGKTEVYLELLAQVLAAGGQALVLVPEIGLTPQIVARLSARLGTFIGVLHSGCTATERARVWSAAAAGHIRVVVGTRSAVFVPLKHPALIIVDEEHDASFKQQEGFRYHARDLAVWRAKQLGIPIVLGSATPSLESYRHACQGRYRLLTLPDRGPHSALPAVRLIDLGREPLRAGLSVSLIEALRGCLSRGEQALLFLNRRGYAPVLFCPECRWHAPCDRCDARLTVHLGRQRLRCHHCGREQPVPQACPQCGHLRLLHVGEGTERIEEALRRILPGARIARVDRDTTASRLSFETLLQKVHGREIDVLIGTQMLAKGHDFPHVTLVGVIAADQGLHGSDFRADEQLFAQIVQVAGRAGRAAKPGEVLIQTYHPAHPLWEPLTRLDYGAFAEMALKDRRDTLFPPYAYCALLRAEARDPESATRFLEAARELAKGPPDVALGCVLPAVLARRAGYHRAQLLATSLNRAALQGWLKVWLPRLAKTPLASRVRWSLDVDPYSLF
ncbi:primosomal protein N' [Acidiferrobacter sp.]|uniref:primosomal protein N' n=1 Tax=Acidiferrobacter sp. TaxID=1872107 RepID=UPI00260A48EB|nr:primosomal protein N' [Acidiferrobacter sp.]